MVSIYAQCYGGRLIISRREQFAWYWRRITTTSSTITANTTNSSMTYGKAPIVQVPFLDLSRLHKSIREPIDEAYRRVMESGWFIAGPELEAFEAEFANYCKVKHCIGVGNGLEALHLLLRAYGGGPGDEVIVPSNTFIATWLAVTQCGATPVPVEPDIVTHIIDPALIGAAITSRTRAIMPVHLYGQPADMDPINELASRHSLIVIEDAAQAQGARGGGRPAGARGRAAGASFYPGMFFGVLGVGGAVLSCVGAFVVFVCLLCFF